MKVYFEPPDKENAIENYAKEQLALIPDDIKEMVKPCILKLSDTHYKYSVKFIEVLKYRTMWALRFLEEKINQEGGMIIVGEDGKLTLIGFSESLAEEIGIHFTKFME